MTIQECYLQLGGNYDEVIGRLRSERLIQKFVLKFTEDGSFELLRRSLAERDRDEAFRAAHTMKGVCQNLGFTKLGDSACKVTEALRGGDFDSAEALFPALEADYTATLNAISEYKQSNGF